MSLLQTFQFNPALFITAVVVVSLAVGSFLNVVIHRLPKMLERGWKVQCAELRGEAIPEEPAYNLVVPRSACPACGHMISAGENIPVVSWLLLGGKCRSCKVRISIRYPAVLWALIALTMIDADTQFLPDDLTLPLLWAGIVVNLWGVFTPLASAVIGAVAGYLSLWSVYWLFKLIRGKEGMGYGDFKLLAALGAWLGWTMLPLIVLLSSVVGAVIGIGLIVFKGRDHEVPIPFGPYLAIAGAIALFFGPALVKLYLP
jgi:leader peptidase (prepilin peptidase) / N-methyltransferase